MWCKRRQQPWVPSSTRLSSIERQQLETAFLGLLYDEFQKIKDPNEVVEEDHPDHPEQSHWRWILHGTREHWWLEIWDDRIAELVGRPYYLNPQGDLSFFDSAWSPDPKFDQTQPEKLSQFFTTITTSMDENWLGQAEALHAYKTGATSDNPPWIHTHGPV